MMRWLRTYPALALTMLFLLLLPAGAQSNSAVRGGLGGVVFDSAGAIVPDVPVVISGPQGSYTAKTDATGHYEVVGVVPGLYKVVIEVAGFKKFVSDRNQVVVDHTATLDIHLTLGAASETVQVDSGAVQIDAETTSLNAPLSDELYESLPLARNVAAIFSLAPGVVSGGGTGTANPSIGGATGLENLYLVDGVTVTDQAFGGLGTYNRYFGSLGTGVNLAFIKEVDVKTGAFEPKYGKAAGGIIEIVTKNGSNTYHGALAAYLGPGAWYAQRYQLADFNYVNTTYANIASNPQYDVAAEFGGYIPHFRDKLFFFGSFDPSLTQTIASAPAGAALASHGDYAYSATTLSWAAKLTYQPFANAQIEASTFGDPTHHNEVPGTSPDNGMAAANATSVGVRYNYGSRDSVARISTAISPTWTAIGSFTYNFNHFDETPAANSYQISNRTSTPYTVSYIGGYEPTKNDDYSINIETEKKLHLLGEHTLSLGYTYEHTNFLDQPSRTGPLAAIPGANAAGTDLAPSMGIHASAIGQLTNASFRLYNADASCTYCTKLNGTPVYLQQIRGTYKGLKVSASDHYHVGWVNDSYQMNHWVNIDAGLRWEEQWYAGSLMKYLFNDNWSPRLGVNIDPFGKHRDKVFFNYARYQSVLPLDAAIRQLGNEQDDSFFFTPKADASGNAVLDNLGVVIPVFDAAHTLNGLPGKSDTAAFGNPTFSSSTGEGILPGTKMEYENEYLLGFQTQIIPGSVISVRYTDRRLGRVIEDIGSESVEGSVLPEGYNGGIANVTAKTDISVNENEVVYTPAQWTAANGSNAPGFFQNPDHAALYNAPVAGCTLSTVTDPKTGKVTVSTGDTSVGNGDFWRHFDGTPYNGACITNLDTSAGGNPDGKPDGFANPSRRYQELVIEYNRNLKNNWQMRANYRFAKLWGNYEGFFRNDNGQSDPGISSLFDFTAGALGLLGDQTKPGFLNTDRRNVANVSVAYTFNSSDSYVSKLSKLTLGTSLRGSTGNPLSELASHPAPSYADTGEVPIGGRGTKGTLPTTLQIDFHTDYPVKLREGYALKLAFDAFNIANTQHMTSKNQDVDSSIGVSSPDYGKPLGFQTPFYARASIRLEF